MIENQAGRNKILCSQDNLSYMCHIRTKGFLNSNFNEALIDKISIFQEIVPNFTYSQKFVFLSIHGN